MVRRQRAVGDGRMTKDPLIAAALVRYRSWRGPRKLPDTLPLLDAFRRANPVPNAFANLDVLFIQHHLGPLIPRIRAMADDGLDLDRCWFVDIPYSTNGRVRQELRKLGCDEDRMTREFDDPLAPYLPSQIGRTKRLITQFLQARVDIDRDLLVVDDGAFFVRALHDLTRRRSRKRIGSLAKRIHVVEQTTRGYRHLQQPSLMETIHTWDIPVVTVAQSYTKNLLESPFIGASVARGILNRLRKDGRTPGDRSLIIGLGKVGKNVTPAIQELSPEAAIDVFDTNLELSREVKALGARPLQSFPETGSYDMVVGCTGDASFPLHARSILADDALLVSGSSGAVEMNREKFVELADQKPDDEIKILRRRATKREGIHASIRFRDAGNEFTFLNGGFPVNFDGLLENLPTSLIQPTHALMFAAGRQALRMNGAGLAYLNFGDDFWIYRNGRRML